MDKQKGSDGEDDMDEAIANENIDINRTDSDSCSAVSS